jgi:hypothetical protein
MWASLEGLQERLLTGVAFMCLIWGGLIFRNWLTFGPSPCGGACTHVSAICKALIVGKYLQHTLRKLSQSGPWLFHVFAATANWVSEGLIARGWRRYCPSQAVWRHLILLALCWRLQNNCSPSERLMTNRTMTHICTESVRLQAVTFHAEKQSFEGRSVSNPYANASNCLHLLLDFIKVQILYKCNCPTFLGQQLGFRLRSRGSGLTIYTAFFKNNNHGRALRRVLSLHRREDAFCSISLRRLRWENDHT